MLKKITIFLTCLFLVGGASIYYYWSQLTKLPPWYERDGNNSNSQISLENQEAIAQAGAKINQKIQREISQAQGTGKAQVNLNLDEGEINELIVTEIAKDPEKKQLFDLANSVKTKIEKERIEIGAVINTKRIEESKLNPQQKILVENILTRVPQLKNKNIYLGIQGKPIVENNQLKLDAQSKIKLGNITLSLEEVAQKTGVSQKKIQELINVNLNKYQIEDLQLKEQEASIELLINN